MRPIANFEIASNIIKMRPCSFLCSLSLVALVILLALPACTPSPPDTHKKEPLSLPVAGGALPLHFLTQAEASEVLGQRDDYFNKLNNFNRQLRLGSDLAITPDEYAAFAAGQALNWTPEEKERVTRLFEKFSPKLKEYQLELSPSSINLIKTTGKEEFNAAYTRGNSIILPQDVLNEPDHVLAQFLLHELFHVYSRFLSDEQRDRLYAVIGYQPTTWSPPLPYPIYAATPPEKWPRFFRPRDISLPHPLVDEAIVNPDALTYRHVIPVSIGMTQLYGLPVLFSRERDPVAGAEMGLENIMGFRLLLVRPNSFGHWRMDPKQRRQGFVRPHEVDGFWQAIGRNTDYIIHPEEVLADNFVLLIAGVEDVKSPDVLENLDAALRADKKEP